MSATAYIAGPMSGYPKWNFDAFDACRDSLREKGWDVISPADLDREIGFDPETSVVNNLFLDEAMKRDVEAIMRVDAMVMLPGWWGSTGAKAEYALARWRHIPVYQWPSMDEIVGRLKVPAEKKAFQHTFVGSEVLGGTDPKAQAGSKKCPMWLLPPVALEEVAWVHQLGAEKYRAYNWRLTGVELTTYISAIMRHLMAIAKGEWLDPESGRPHAAHIAASCNILMDADSHGKLDR